MLEHRFHKFLILVPLFLVFACDPGAPGATGIVSVNNEINSNNFKILNIFIYSNPSKVLNISIYPKIEDSEGVDCFNLNEITFPYDYIIGGGVGVTDYKNWTIIAWLSQSCTNWPQINEPYGFSFFEIKDCGSWASGYCNYTDHVNFEISEIRTE